MMDLAGGLFLLAFWAPPLAVAVGALALLKPLSSPSRSVKSVRAVPMTH